MTRLVYSAAADLGPYAAGLCALEAGIAYPVGDGADHFTIDHGPSYHPFFSQMGDAHFLIGIDGDDVVASLAGVLRTAVLGDRRIETAYLADLKLAPTHRGGGLNRRIAMKCLQLLWAKPGLRRWRLAYGAAMRGERGDVTRTLRGLHPGRILRPLARLRLFFEPPDKLRGLGEGPPRPPQDGLDLSGASGSLFESTKGRKDLRLDSTGAHWPLMHLCRPPQQWTDGLGGILAQAADLPTDTVACFGLDERLDDHIRWLHAAGVEPGATCTLYALVLPGTLPPALPWVHVATSEI